MFEIWNINRIKPLNSYMYVIVEKKIPCGFRRKDLEYVKQR